MIFLTLIAILLLLNCLRIFGFLINPGFTSIYDALLVRKPFYESPELYERIDKEDIWGGLFGHSVSYAQYWATINRWMMVVCLVAVISLIVAMVLIRKKKVEPYISYVPIYVCHIISTAVYYLTTIKGGRYEFTMNLKHFEIFLSVIYSLIMIIVCIRGYIASRKYGDLSCSDNKIPPKLKYIVTAAVVVLFSCTYVYWYDAYGMCRDYSVNYGVFEGPDSVRRLYIENYVIGNFQNRAVDTEQGLYYLDDYRGEYHRINVMDSIGAITEIYSGDYCFTSIGYADGYLFLSTPDEILRFDPSDCSFESLIKAEEGFFICDACVLDNKLYFEEYGDRDHQDEVPFIMVSDITGGVLSDPVLYLSDIRTSIYGYPYGFHSYDWNSNLLQTYIACDNGTLYQGEGQCNMQLYDGCRNYLRYDEMDSVSMLFVGERQHSIQNVGAFSLYNGSLYFVSLTDTGIDLCRSDLNGENIEIIDSMDLGRDCSRADYHAFQLVIGQGKIMVIADGRIFLSEEQMSRDHVDLDVGRFTFVTDLK